MKIVSWLFFCTLILFYCHSCNNSKNNAQSAVFNYLTKNINEDIDIKIVDVLVLKTITVGDSILYFSDQFKAQQQTILDRLENDRLEIVQRIGTEKSYEQEQSRKLLSSLSQAIDSLKQLVPDYPDKYRKSSPDILLVKIVNCKYQEVYKNGEIKNKTMQLKLSADGGSVLDDSSLL